jgi:hypothetical protein
MPHESPFHDAIMRQLVKINRTELDPRHIEGYMRLQYGNLGNLDDVTFLAEAKICAQCIDAGGVEEAESNAVSFGM